MPALHPLRPVLLAALLLLGARVHAADYQLADGQVRFQVPDAWPQIMMQVSGNPQFMAFEVPNAAPVGQRVLARVTVISEPFADAQAFKKWVDARVAQSHRLPGYQALAGGGVDSDAVRYKAVESGIGMHYSERYYYRAGYGVQLRCLRPASSTVPASWVSQFDAGCRSIGASLQQGG